MEGFDSFIPVDRRHALSRGVSLPEHVRGAVLMTDISGFTPLTEALVAALGIQRGAEELGNYLNKVYGILIHEILLHHGVIISSGGDALVSWFEGPENEAAQSAVTAALSMQESIAHLPTTLSNGGMTVELAIKSAVASGTARRFLIGDPHIQVFEVLAGGLLNQVDLAENYAHRSEVVLTAETRRFLGDEVILSGQRQTRDGTSIVVAGGLNRVSRPHPWLPPPELKKEQAKPWLHPFIFEHINSGHEMFMAQLRPSIALFMSFEGIDFEQDPEAGKKLNEFFRCIQKDVAYYDGTIVSITTGDKGSYLYIAVGMPHGHEDDAIRTVELARSLLNIPHKLDFIREVRIGVSRGMIWSGPVGNQKWRTFSAIGNEVNLAARLMQAARPGHMLVSQRIADATQSDYQWQLLQEISVKGISKPVKVFEPTVSRHSSRISKLTSSTEIVGREAERMLLSEMLQDTRASSSKVVIIEGEAGIGKSRLISDLLSQAREGNIQTLVGTGYAIEQSTPYHAWRSVFESVFGLQTEDDSEIRRSKALDWIEAQDAGLVDRAPLLAPVLSLDVQDNSLTGQMTGQVRAENTRLLLIAILKLFIGSSSTLLVLEDAHWFDSASLALCVDACRDLSNVMLVISTRMQGDEPPGALASILDLPQVRHIKLEQMSQDDITSLICHRLGVEHVPEQVTALILAKAEGHPFFSEELASSLVETGVISVENGECSITSEADLLGLHFPDTVQGVVRSRIDRLSPSHQLALKAASVVGRIFALRAVSDVYPLDADRPQLGGYFEYLRLLDLTPLNSEIPDISYLFKHVITQEVAYNLMPFSQRQTFHQAVANWYEQTFADDLSPYYGVLAYHWNNAKNPQKTVDYLEKAGEQAMNSFACREAMELFTEAIGLVEKGEVQVSKLRHAHWERQLGEACYGQGELPKSLEHLKKAIQLMGWKTPEAGFALAGTLLGEVFKQISFRMRPRPMIEARLPGYLDDTEQARLLEGAIAFVRLGHIYYQTNRSILLILGTLNAINLAEKAGLKSPILARCYTNMCIATGVLARHDWAIAYRNRAHAMARDVQELTSLSYSLAGCAVYEVGAALWDDASKSLQESIEIDSRIGDMRHLDEGKCILELVRLYQCDLRYGIATATEVLERAAQRKDILPQIWARATRAEMILQRSAPDTLRDAVDDYHAALKLLEQNIDLANDIRVSGALALVYWRMGETHRALDLAAATVKKTTGNPTAPYSIEGYAGVAEVFLHAWATGDAGQRANARKACKAMAKYASVFPLGLARLKLYQGWFDWLDGKQKSARNLWQSALSSAERLNLRYEQGRALLFLGSHAQDKTERAKLLNDALQVFDECGVDYEAEEIRRIIALSGA